MTDKYLLFQGSNFYPTGGWGDFQGYFDSIDEAKNRLYHIEEDASYLWAHIVYKNKIILWASSDNDLSLGKSNWIWRDEE